ncbi:Nucleosome-remodeling factor subunit BPTF isoform A [Chlorella sorokiniana]|uniref:Nucleosome-remodeling factor subunit BPTF isoform A n=1 Tax=Chlorella sorokiniana TaxID=3076 RepID=A0A2P6TPY0_CHLSO|nr:Nucleosome-remodeling factor subunit BPTF isoform A [Chlorella sorokiniana]|eukprot:PRW56093.1 Nucleosome-remodeling factor subunit BPTF isoform A [Chlorella sorokiniana]
MTSETYPAGEGSIAAELQQQQQQQAGVKQEMPHSEAAVAAAAAAAAEGPASGTTESEEPAPSADSKRQRRIQKEMAALGFEGSIALDSGRPSRRAASAAQAAIAAAQAYEVQRGMDPGMSPPRPAEQSAAMQFMQATAGHAQAPQQAQQAAAAQQADGAADPSDAAGAENGPLGHKRKRADKAGPATASPTEEGSTGGAPASPAASGGATGASTPAVPPEPAKPVDLEPLIELARQCGSQDELRQRLQERYPATRGRSAINSAFRDIFATLCPGQVFNSRSGVLPHMSHRLFQLAGKPVGKAPTPYKPRGPKSPSGMDGDFVDACGAAAPEAAAAAVPAMAVGPAAAVAAAEGGGAPGGPAAAQAAEFGSTPAAAPGGGQAVGPAAAAAARAAATAEGTTAPAGSLGPAEALSLVQAEFGMDLVRIATLVRRTLGMQRGSVAHLRMVLKTNHLAGMDIRFQAKSGRLLNRGKLNERGAISCFCRQCNGKDVSASEFEEHSGSKDRRPADGIFMEANNRSLKELLNLINSPEMATAASVVDVHMDACYKCKEGGELLCCDGCNCAFHPACVDLAAPPTGDWFCPLCVAQGITTKPQPLPLQPKQVTALKPLKASKSRPGSSSKLSKAARESGGGGAASQGGTPAAAPKAAAGGGGGGTGRVHMAAPTAPRAPRLGRSGGGARSNKNKRLFEGEEGALVNGQKLFYRTTQGETLLEGVAVVERGGPSGILCGCCNTLISASGFEAHAGRGQRRAPYDNIFTEDGMTLKAMAALLPDLEEEAPARGEYGLEDVADDAREVISELDTLAGGCVLCHETDFQRGGFGPRTIMLCDQCEREFHVGCLKKCGKCDLDAVPEGEWHCSEECERIRAHINAAIQGQQMDIPGYPSHTWQVFRGKDGRSATAWALRSAQEILQESFDPIMDLGSNTDLLPVMLYARRAGEWDYSNCLTLLLRHKGKPVVAAICRVFGPQMAELPLIATKNTARRQGHARILVGCFEQLLKDSGVHTLVLPAAHETVETWKNGFNFVDMPEDDVRLAKQQLRILIFPGTEVLYKHFEGVKPPEGHHVLVPPPDRISPEEAADAMEVAAITANMVACVAAACGEPVLPETLGMTPAEVAQHATGQQAAPAAGPAAAQQRQHQRAWGLGSSAAAMQQPGGGEAGWFAAPWWERGPGSTVQCRDATPAHCTEERFASTQCSTEVDPDTGEPVRHCVKLYRRYLKCAGRPEKVDEEKQEITARGEGAQQLEPHLMELPAGPGSSAAAAAVPGGVSSGAARVQDVGHAFEEFLRFAEELQEEMVPGVLHLDEVPPAAARPYSEGAAEQQQAGGAPPGGAAAEQQHFSWLGGLLFGKRRGGEQHGRRPCVDASTWREFEKDFTEV